MTKKEKEQTELFHAETTWFHVFKDMIDSGDMANLDGSAIKVYLVIKSYTNFSTGRAFPAIELIAEKAGLSKIQVMRCLKNLEQAEYITKSKAGRNNVYTLREKVSIKDSEGRPQAVATWDYIPNSVRDAISELKHAVVTGEMIDGRVIHIEKLVLNVATGDSTQININGMDLDKMPSDIQEKLFAIREALNRKTK
jgi:DNA-binding transcriptional regulator YhcF (GntR family)